MPDPNATSAEHLKSLFEEGKISREDYEILRAALETAPASPTPPRREEEPKRWGKSWTNRQIGGVCGGLAEGMGISAWRVRLIFIIAFLLSGGTALFIYLALYFFMPWKEPTPWNGLKNLSWSFASGVILFGLIHIGVNFFLIPKIMIGFSQMGGALPGFTRWVIRLGHFTCLTPLGIILQILFLGALIVIDRIMPRGRTMRRIYEWIVSWSLLILLCLEVLVPLASFRNILHTQNTDLENQEVVQIMHRGEERQFHNLRVRLLRVEPNDAKDRNDDSAELSVSTGSQTGALNLRKFDSQFIDDYEFTAEDVRASVTSTKGDGSLRLRIRHVLPS